MATDFGQRVRLSLNQALLIGSTLQLGGTIGSVVMGLKIDKTGFYKVLIPVFLVAVISVALIGYSVSHIVLLFIIIFIAGFAIVGGQPAINALSASYYPVSLRTTGGLEYWNCSFGFCHWAVIWRLSLSISGHYPFICDCCHTFAIRHYHADDSGQVSVIIRSKYRIYIVHI